MLDARLRSLPMPTITVDSRPVTYAAAGEPGSTPLVCVHGFTGSAEDFAGALDGLAAGRRVYAPDLPGHGGSAGPDDPGAYGLDALAGTVLEFADAVGLGEFHLLGHSLGGLVAQRVAAVASHRLTSLVLAGTGLGAPPEASLEYVTRIAAAVRDHGLAAGLAATGQQPDGGASGHGQDAASVEERFLALAPASVIGEARALVTAAPMGAFLRGIDVPVLVLHGEDEDVWPEAEQRHLARTVAGARRVVIPGSGHAAQREDPAAWSAAVARFLGAVDGADSR